MRDSTRLRFVDRSFGRLVCFIFSLLQMLRPKRKTSEIKNVLVIELFEMGASLMTYPSLKYIRDSLNDPNIYCLTTRGMKESWEITGVIPEEHVVTVDDSSPAAFLRSLTKAVRELNKKDIHMIIDFELFMRISAIVSFLIRADRRAGFHRYEFEGLYRGTFYDIGCAYNQNSHIARNFLALTKAALQGGGEYPNFKGRIEDSELVLPHYMSDPGVRRSVERKISDACPLHERMRTRLAVIAPDVGPNLAMRNYPRDYFVDVARGLLTRHPDMIILLIGTEESRASCSYIAHRVDDTRCVDFCAKTSFAELWELIDMAELLISNDNGPVHFASVTGTKTLALFSTDSPFVYGPLGKCVIAYTFYQCSPCITAYNHKNSKCENNLCLQSLPPERVIALADTLLSDRARYRTINNDLPYI